MLNKDLKRAGFSIIELMIGITAASILALAVGLTLSNNVKSWVQFQELLQLQRDATLVRHVATKEIRISTMDQITVSPGGILFTAGGARTSPESIYRAGGDVVYSGPGGSYTLVRDSTKDFSVVKQTNQVAVTVELETPDGFAETQSFVVYARNEI